MKRIAAILLLAACSAAWSIPAYAQRENRSIGENGQEAKKASKQYRKAQNKAFKKQRKAMKKNQKAQRKLAKRQQHHK
jgi:Tat protein secretion system quality control protein TatD with DNase activity